VDRSWNWSVCASDRGKDMCRTPWQASRVGRTEGPVEMDHKDPELGSMVQGVAKE
jgi:hypothetical protein